MNIAFFEILKGLDMRRKHLIATVISGPESGERVILSEGRCVCGGEEGLLAEHMPELRALEGVGIAVIGDQEVYYEELQGRPKIVICGGGHVGLALAGLLVQLRAEVTVIDDRPMYADLARETGADRVICDSFQQALAAVEDDRNIYFVIMTRGHRFDMVCLKEIMKKPHAYIGLMASRKRAAMIRQTIVEEGFSEAEAEALHVPIGLKIGAETPDEIAVSVAAELIKVHSEGRKRAQMPKEITETVLHAGTGELPCVLATIIHRKGSGPRDAGTKMLIRADGRTVGTVGGGCNESAVITLARRMMAAPDGPKCIRHLIDLRFDDTESEDGMACGGTMEVFLEMIM